MARKIKNTLEFCSALAMCAAGAGYSASQVIASSTPLGWVFWGWLGVACVVGVFAVSATASEDVTDETNGEGW